LFAGFPHHDAFTHARVLTFDTSTLTDADNSTFTMYAVDRLPPHFAMQPAVMHGAHPGDPMYFVESLVPGGASGGGGFIDVVQMTNKLSTAPTFSDFKVLVPHYNFPPNADQLGGVQVDTGDGRILSAAWRDGRLVATHTAQNDTDQTAQVRWYEFSTAAATPTLTQTGTIDRGPGVATFMPSINIAPNGDLGMTFLESSASEYLSMDIAGQKGGAAAGTVQGPILAKAGEATLRIFHAGGELGAPLRTGDYSGVAIDPTDGSFWAANEYSTTAPPPPPGTRGANWGTWIAQFTLSADAATTVAASRAAASGTAAHQLASAAAFSDLAAALLAPASVPPGPGAAPSWSAALSAPSAVADLAPLVSGTAAAAQMPALDAVFAAAGQPHSDADALALERWFGLREDLVPEAGRLR
jgi:hypothetical protein